MNAPVLLTGASGFIGGAALRHFAGRRVPVVAIARSRPAESPAGVEWLERDLLSLDTDGVAALVAERRITHALHAAWYTNHADYLDSPVNARWRDASAVFAEGFYGGGGRRLVATGTCLEYDTAAADGPLREAAPLAPILPYAVAKAETAALLASLSARRQGAMAWARVFFVYGPGDRSGRFVPHILNELRAGRTVEPRFGGAVRDYVHVDDLAAQLAAILTGDVVGAVNVGSGEAVTMSALCGYAADAFGRPDLAEANFAGGDRLGDWIAPDLTRLRSETDAPPARLLRDGLRALIEAA